MSLQSMHESRQRENGKTLARKNYCSPQGIHVGELPLRFHRRQLPKGQERKNRCRLEAFKRDPYERPLPPHATTAYPPFSHNPPHSCPTQHQRLRHCLSHQKLLLHAPRDEKTRLPHEKYLGRKSRKELRSPREKLINLIRSLDPELYDGVIELGTGNGWLLNRLSKKMARKRPLTGLDLNEHTILRDRAKYKKNKSLRFLCSDLPTYAKRHTLKRKLLISCFVLEFFSHRELIKLCKLLRTNAQNYLAIIERIDSPHKVRQETKPIGGFSYSHDYERIFKKYGIQKMYTHEDTA